MTEQRQYADRTPSSLTGDCGVDGCNRPVWRQDLCASHFKRKQRGKRVSTPIGDHIAPGGLEPGEQLTAGELLVVRANQLAEVDSEDDQAWEKARAAVLRAAERWAAAQGWVNVKRGQVAPVAPAAAEQIGWTEEAAAQARDLFADHMVKNLRCSRCTRWAVRVGFVLKWGVEPADREHRIVTAQPTQLQSFCERCGFELPSVRFGFAKGTKGPKRGGGSGKPRPA